MKNIKLILPVILGMSFIFCAYPQKSETVDDTLGYRIKKNSMDYFIYSDNNLSPNFNDNRKINYRVFFRKVNTPVKEIKGKKYQLITIPGSSSYIPQNKASIPVYSRNGLSINKEDFDQNFWIDQDLLNKNVNVEYYKYANQVFSGLLTSPFKYRLKSGTGPESLIDGDFNVAPFIGWKFRVSSEKPYYLAPFIFTGFTTLSYSASNNTGIVSTDKSENGTGITYGLGLTFRLGDISPGIVLGYDHGLGNLGSTFMYTDKPWISFSLSYDFLKPQKTAEGSN